MNILELENLVKSVPDEQLIKEVQAPSGKIPQFLALSEVQRRKDMRERYEAQKNGGQKPTIAEQIIGGGIGSLPGAQGAQGAPVPTPAATGIPSVGAPPAAPGAAPMPTPPGMPQGFAAGGVVGYADGGGVAKPARLTEIEKLLASNERIVGSGLGGFLQRAYKEGMMPLGLAQRKRLEAELAPLKAKYTSDVRNMSFIEPPPPPPAPTVATPGAGAVLAMSSPSAPSPPAPRSAYAVAPGGIGSIDPNEAVSGKAGSATSVPRPAPAVSIPGVDGGAPAPAPASDSAPAQFKNLYGMTPAQVMLAEKLLDPNANKVPDAINYDELIAQAGQSEKDVREAAKREAIGAALVKLGAGLASGNMGAGLSAAGDEASQIMRQGRADASAERRVAQQLTLQAKQGQREQALQQQALERDNLVALATLESQTKAQAEEKAYRLQSLAQSAEASNRSYAIQLKNQQLSERQYQDAKKTTAINMVGSALDIAIGKPPSATEMSAWLKMEEEARKRPVRNSKGEMVPGTSGIPNPQVEYERKMREALPNAVKFASEQTGVDMASLSKLVTPTGSTSAKSSASAGLAKPSGTPKYKVGQKIKVNGKIYEVTGGDLTNNPELKEVP